MHEEMCGRFDTDVFIAADLCCSCHGGETVSKGEIGDNCQDWDETTSRYAPDCKKGLLCLYEEQTDVASIPGMSNFCAEPEGSWTIEDRLGYWYHSRYSDDVHDGYWISEDEE